MAKPKLTLTESGSQSLRTAKKNSNARTYRAFSPALKGEGKSNFVCNIKDYDSPFDGGRQEAQRAILSHALW